MNYFVLMNSAMDKIWMNDEKQPFRYTSIEEAKKGADKGMVPVQEFAAKELVFRQRKLTTIRRLTL